jgi:HlyD family secretion protein
MEEDKAQLLRSLEIDRSVQQRPPGRGGLYISIAAGIAIVGIAALWQPWRTPSGASAPSAAASPAAGSAVAEPALSGSAVPAAAPRPSAGLVASGYIVARRVATVSAQITGKVVDVLVEEGMSVKEGQVLARLDATIAEIDLSSAKAGVVVAEAGLGSIAADLRDAERTLGRVQTLSKQSFASDADRIRAVARAESLRAQLRRAEAEIESARIRVTGASEQVARHSVRAPFAGVVTVKNAQPGEIISPLSSGGFTRTGVCTIVDMDSLEVEVDVNEANIGRVFAGQRVEAVLDAYADWKIPAQVIAIIPTADRSKATIKVRIGLKARDSRILPDMAAKVTFFDRETTPTPAG